MRTLNVEGFHRVSSVSDSRAAARLRRAASIASGAPVITVGIEAGDTGRESRVDGPLNFVMWRSGRVEVDSGEAVDLKIDEAGGDEGFESPASSNIGSTF